jgi:integrase/recombinase XerD
MAPGWLKTTMRAATCSPEYRSSYGSASYRTHLETSQWNQLPIYVEPFVDHWLRQHGSCDLSESKLRLSARPVRNAIRQLLQLIIPDYSNNGRSRDLSDPFTESVPQLFDFLRRDRGLREATIVQYQHYLRPLEEHLGNSRTSSLADLSPALITAFITDAGKSLDQRSVQSLCSILKTFLRYLHQTGILRRDLSQAVVSPRRYRLAGLPRSISQEEVQHMLTASGPPQPYGEARLRHPAAPGDLRFARS